MESIQFTFSPEMQKQLEAAQKRIEAHIAEVGQEQYDREVEDRRTREFAEWMIADMKRAARYMLGERFMDCTFENFTENANNIKAFTACKRFVEGFKKDSQGLILSGPNGIGKNHIAAAIVNALTAKFKRSYFGNITKIKTKICDAFGASVEDAIEKIIDYDLICIHDLGVENDTKFADELIFDLTDRIYNDKKPLIITTNLNDDELYARYGPRIVSRILGMCDALCYTDYDHRLK